MGDPVLILGHGKNSLMRLAVTHALAPMVERPVVCLVNGFIGEDRYDDAVPEKVYRKQSALQAETVDEEFLNHVFRLCQEIMDADDKRYKGYKFPEAIAEFVYAMYKKFILYRNGAVATRPLMPSWHREVFATIVIAMSDPECAKKIADGDEKLLELNHNCAPLRDALSKIVDAESPKRLLLDAVVQTQVGRHFMCGPADTPSTASIFPVFDHGAYLKAVAAALPADAWTDEVRNSMECVKSAVGTILQAHGEAEKEKKKYFLC